MTKWEINGFTLEFDEVTHTYIYEGVVLPSITQMLGVKFGRKYDGIDKATLENAARKGTEVHEVIERFCKYGEESELKELRNFKFIQKHYKFEVVDNEVPVILWDRKFPDLPLAAGRLDLVLTADGKKGLADIKRTSALDKNYLAYQLNLYRIAYMQTYGENIEFLKGVHLREDTRKYVDIPINEDIAWEIVNLYFTEVNNA